MKKSLALILAFIMVFSVIACSANETSEAPDPSSQNASSNAAPEAPSVPSEPHNDSENTEPLINKDSLPKFKIAFAYGQWESVLGIQYKALMEYLCESFNCEPVYFSAANGENGVAAVESLLAAGDIDGILSVGFDTARMAVADKYKVPVVAINGFPSEAEISSVAAYDLFLGGINGNDYWAGSRTVESLYEAGCRNITFSGLTSGFAKGHDDRARGVKDAVAAHPDLKLLSESYSMGKFSDDVATFNAAFPEMDGIAFSAVGDAVYNALETEGLTDGSLLIAGCDVSSMTGNYFEKGVQIWSCGGQYSAGMLGWAILYNYLIDGTKIISDNTVPIEIKYIEIRSHEEFLNYQKYVESSMVYTAEEIAGIIHYFNADVTFEDYVTAGDLYSLDDVIRRHG